MNQDESSSPVDRYLDALFDRLAGTGTAGRRALIEADDHLHASVTDAVRQGTPRERAEREAVERFGDASTIARQLRRAQRPALLAMVLSTVWQLAGLASATLAVTYFAAAAVRWTVQALNPPTGPECPVLAGTCLEPLHLAALMSRGAVFATLATVLLLGRSLTRRRFGLSASTRRLPTILAVLCAFLTPLVFLLGALIGPYTHVLMMNFYFPDADGPGPYFSVIAAGVTAAAGLAATTWAVTRHFRPAAKP